jgi:hypothetical protein
MDKKYLTILYNIHNIIHVVKTGHIICLPEFKPLKLRVYYYNK